MLNILSAHFRGVNRNGCVLWELINWKEVFADLPSSMWEFILCNEENRRSGELQARVLGVQKLAFGPAARQALHEVFTVIGTPSAYG